MAILLRATRQGQAAGVNVSPEEAKTARQAALDFFNKNDTSRVWRRP